MITTRLGAVLNPANFLAVLRETTAFAAIGYQRMVYLLFRSGSEEMEVLVAMIWTFRLPSRSKRRMISFPEPQLLHWRRYVFAGTLSCQRPKARASCTST